MAVRAHVCLHSASFEMFLCDWCSFNKAYSVFLTDVISHNNDTTNCEDVFNKHWHCRRSMSVPTSVQVSTTCVHRSLLFSQFTAFIYILYTVELGSSDISRDREKMSVVPRCRLCWKNHHIRLFLTSVSLYPTFRRWLTGQFLI